MIQAWDKPGEMVAAVYKTVRRLNPATPIEPGLKAPAVSLDETSS
jgi:hypothetical protein